MSGTRSFRRRINASSVAAIAAATLLATFSLVPVSARSQSSDVATRAAPDSSARVIVQADSVAAAYRAVAHLGGHVSRSLPIVDGVAADVPSASLARLDREPGIRAVTPDSVMHVQGTIENGDRPPSVYGEAVRADELVDAGYAGAGVTVAVIDTGISDTPDLVGRVLQVPSGPLGLPADCVNLSGEPTCVDGYGHGTFLAGIIAGDGTASDGEYTGIAPEANLISIKVGSSDGSADVSNVLAAIQWAVSFKDRFNIRVINLALGTDSTQSWLVDPLNKAVEKAWRAGVVVVIAASNRGPAPQTISKPADDPHVITVGATDDAATADLSDDRMPDFSGRGPTAEGAPKPDVVAPGAHIVSLRAVGSAIDQHFPNYIDDTYRQGSGTSMSAAVVSGVVADILSARPDFVPNRVKYALMSTARPDAVTDPYAVGRGIVDAFGAAFEAPRGRANRGLDWSSGRGDLDLSRGSVQVILDDPWHTLLSGLLTAQLQVWDVTELLGDWTELGWTLSVYNLLPWFSSNWYGNPWQGHNWEGCSTITSHSDECFYGHNWEGSTWYGAWD